MSDINSAHNKMNEATVGAGEAGCEAKKHVTKVKSDVVGKIKKEADEGRANRPTYEHLCDAITCELIVDPVIGPGGQLFERSSYNYFKKKTGLCPFTQLALKDAPIQGIDHKTNVRNLIAAGHISNAEAEDWEKKCASLELQKVMDNACRGVEDDMVKIGLCYQKGELGLIKSSKQAQTWFRNAFLSCNSVKAATHLGIMLVDAEQQPEGMFYLGCASIMGSDLAKYRLCKWFAYKGQNEMAKRLLTEATSDGGLGMMDTVTKHDAVQCLQNLIDEQNRTMEIVTID